MLFTHISPAITPSDPGFDLRCMEGKWFLHYTNFEFFHPNACLNVRFNLSAVNEEPLKFLSVIEFSRRQEPSDFCIRGFDTADPLLPGHLVYSGTGPLSSTRIPWKVIGLGSHNEWAVSVANMGKLGPEFRLDILGRYENIAPEQVSEIYEFIGSQLGSCKAVSTLFRVDQDW